MYISSYISIQRSIYNNEKKLISLQTNLDTYNKNVAEMQTAKTELEQIKSQYDSDFRAAFSYPNKILAMDSLGLIGVESIQSAVAGAYSGTKEKSLINAMTNTLTGLQKKIDDLEKKITTCEQNISTTQDTLETLRTALATAI